jgi:hypothetical protein
MRGRVAPCMSEMCVLEHIGHARAARGPSNREERLLGPYYKIVQVLSVCAATSTTLGHNLLADLAAKFFVALSVRHVAELVAGHRSLMPDTAFSRFFIKNGKCRASGSRGRGASPRPLRCLPWAGPWQPDTRLKRRNYYFRAGVDRSYRAP